MDRPPQLAHGLRARWAAAAGECLARVDQDLGARPVVWIGVASALALFLELSLIRWMGGLLPQLTGLRNMVLLAAFLGLGAGMLRGGTRPLLLWLGPALVGLQYLQAAWLAGRGLEMGAALAAGQFLGVVLATWPAGELVGRLLARRSDLAGYGANLLGSLCGVLLANVVAALWLPPAAWLALIGLGWLVALHRARSVVVSLVAMALLVGAAELQLPPFDVWSPYQRLSLSPSGFGHGPGDGRLALFSNGRYYQSFPAIDTTRVDPERDVRHEVPDADTGPIASRLAGARVLALGAGAGANLPALLRAGASSVVAVDIDPLIVQLGRELNGDRPYYDPRVRVVVDDARAYLRASQEQFDLVLFLWIDSHPGVASAAGFRLDSFVYTVEAFREAEARLAPGGAVLVYAWMNDVSAGRILRALQAAFPERGVSAFQVGPYPAQVLFAVGEVDPSGGSPWVRPVGVQLTGRVPLVEDDWPFLYVHPGSAGTYLMYLAIVLVASLVAVLPALPRAGGGGAGQGGGARAALLASFLFGAAFMLLETVGIMQVSLLLGHTWQVVGAVIAGLLLTAWCGNALVAAGAAGTRALPWAVGLLLTLLALWRFRAGDLAAAFPQAAWTGWALLGLVSLPVLFSSVLYSLLVRSGRASLEQLLGANLLGAMAGGCLEWAAMVFGYRTMTLTIPLLYLLALGAWRPGRPPAPDSGAAPVRPAG